MAVILSMPFPKIFAALPLNPLGGKPVTGSTHLKSFSDIFLCCSFKPSSNALVKISWYFVKSSLISFFVFSIPSNRVLGSLNNVLHCVAILADSLSFSSLFNLCVTAVQAPAKSKYAGKSFICINTLSGSLSKTSLVISLKSLTLFKLAKQTIER